jgi:3-oxoacyl-[acyl-carrier protein] reductase
MSQTALITGASRGIGRAIALRLASDGYDILAAARSRPQLDELQREITSNGGSCRVICMDVSNAADVRVKLAGVEADVLVNNAGIGIIKPFVDLSPDEWRSMIDVNINSLYRVTSMLLPGMISRKRGQICTIGSIAGRSAWSGGSCYAATKAFVTSWSESLMLEVREHGIKVSVVMPGGVATEFGGKTPTPADAWKLSAVDVASAVAYILASPAQMLVHRLEVRTNTVPPKK